MTLLDEFEAALEAIVKLRGKLSAAELAQYTALRARIDDLREHVGKPKKRGPEGALTLSGRRVIRRFNVPAIRRRHADISWTLVDDGRTIAGRLGGRTLQTSNPEGVDELARRLRHAARSFDA